MNPPASDTSLLSLSQVHAMLAARRRLIAWVAAGTLAATAALLLVLPRVWTASSDVFIDYKENDPISGRSFSALLDDSYMQTQIDMIQSQAVVERMARTLGLLPSGKGGPDPSASDGQLIASIQRNIEVTSQRNSRVLTVSFSADSPQRARDYANALVNAYIAVTQEISSSSARARSEQYTAQLEQLRDEIEAAQDTLTRYQQETGILDSRQYGDLESRRLGEMTTALLTLQTQLQETRARNQAMERLLADGVRPADLPQVAQITAINDLKDGLTAIDRQLGEVRGSLGPNHPTVRGLLAERGRLESAIDRQAKAALQAQRNELGRLQEQEREMQREIDAQRAKVLEQMAQRDRIASYQRQLAGIEQVYNAALARYDGILMAGNISLPNLAVLRAAETPGSPSRPQVRRSLALALLVGTAAGLCLALLLELWQRRIRCVDDLRRQPGLQMLGRIGRPAASAGASL